MFFAQAWAQSDEKTASALHDGEAATVAARRDGDVVFVEARAKLQGEPRLAWDVLTDYEGYADFIPDLKSSRVVTRSGNSAVVEQHGEAGFFWFHFPMTVTLEVTEVVGASVSSRALAGTFKEMVGVYRLTETSTGVWLTYSGRMVPAFALPPLVGVPALRSAVEKQFGALVREIARRAQNPRDQGLPQ